MTLVLQAIEPFEIDRQAAYCRIGICTELHRPFGSTKHDDFLSPEKFLIMPLQEDILLL